MKNHDTTILATAYAVNPFKGSENGMGWNFIIQIARFQKVIAITRKNNQPAITQFMEEFPSAIYQNITFKYYDLPYWMRFWKKGGRGAMLYFYLWQLFMPFFIFKNNLKFDIVHNVNFHNDWTPSFLWLTGKPFVWGPIGHHSKIPKQFLLPIYGIKAYLKDRAIWLLKLTFWNFEPFLKLTKWKAKKILAMNSSVEKVLNPNTTKLNIVPSVSSEQYHCSLPKKQGKFIVLSAGRLVPLKGFDVTVRSFARFFHQLTVQQQKNTELILVGNGSEKNLIEAIIQEEKVEGAVLMIDWVERKELMKIYEDASVFLFPSHEGAGMVISEALSFGLPIICFDNDGPGELIDKSCGLSVAYKDYDTCIREFAAYLKVLFEDKKTYHLLSHGALQKFEKTFDWDSKGELIQKIYKDLMK